MRFADPRSDIGFKKIFGSEHHKDILISFLNAVLGYHDEHAIVSVDFMDTHQMPVLEGLKESTLDIRVVDGRGITFLVEMQVECFAKRAMYYSAKAYSQQIRKGVDYPMLNQVVFLGILNFSFFEGSDAITRHRFINMQTNNHDIKEIELNFVELPKFNLSENELESTVDKWLYFLKNTESLTVVPDSIGREPSIAAALQVVDQVNWTKEELWVYDYWSMEEGKRLDVLQTAVKAAQAEGMAKGEAQGKLEVALSMHAKQMPLSLIAELTGLTEDEIGRL